MAQRPEKAEEKKKRNLRPLKIAKVTYGTKELRNCMEAVIVQAFNGRT